MSKCCFAVIKLLNPEKVERKSSEAREGLTHLHFLVDLMEGHLIWGLFVSDLLLKWGLSSSQELQVLQLRHCIHEGVGRELNCEQETDAERSL
ncbi:hypothetical protein EUGRSUZ_H01693 [Eucalyptus grandis]|uniref:Uncharacterized protein n=2 Tax=Eucalyptus grandis TaxID=71139 RepID=A0ACC3JRK0_EUCGR|nr:hypothetical protein EUGRSUZ_H01693 [Eucalyptus grandis]